jgi:hypothetical protein
MVTRFDVHVVAPHVSCCDRSWFDGDQEADALALALEQVGPNQTQVSITAHTEDLAGSFALRHIVWESGEVRDTGWRRWLAGEFIGGGDLAAFA